MEDNYRHAPCYYDFTRNMSVEQAEKFRKKQGKKLTGVLTEDGTKVVSYNEKLKLNVKDKKI